MHKDVDTCIFTLQQNSPIKKVVYMFNHTDDEAGIWHCMGFHKSVMSRLLDKHVSYFDGFCIWVYKTVANNTSSTHQ